ncbi:MAG: hypothetical protein HY360_23525 [Verrucomicrobia bacterium]|nr:hypothetical protein [Verrucomicrobiota bacterium]
MNPPPSFDELRAPLESARRMFFLRTAACVASGIGLSVVLAEVWIAFSFFEKNPASWTRVLRFIPAGLALTLLGAGAAALFAWNRHRAIQPIAERAQKFFPELGLRLSASLEAPALNYCPPAIRAALWQDALTRLAGTPWKKFTGRGRTIFWTGLALGIIFFHAALTFPLLLRWALPRKIETFVQTQIAKETFHPKLEIAFPNKDQWATRMESIPLTVRGESPLGLSRLRLKVSVNGEPARELPLKQDALDKSMSETTGSLDLDELKVKDYDVVSYSVIADAQRPDGRPVQAASQMFFVQIEPFRKDVPVADALPTDGLRKFVDLVNLLADEQRQAVRAAWQLQSLDPQSETHREAVAQLVEAQKRIAERARAAYEQAAREFGAAVSKELLMDLDEAHTHMEIALRHLEKQEWSAALSSEQKALSGLVDILRDIAEAARKDEEQVAQNQPNAAAPPTRTISRDPSELKQLVQQQAQLNRDVEALKSRLPTLVPAEAQVQEQSLSVRQQSLAQKTGEAGREKGRSEPARQTLEEARAAMEQNAAAMLKQSPQESRSSNPPGEKAQQLLEQAVAQEIAEKQLQQASDLRKIFRQLSARQNDLQKSEGPAPEKQAATARSLAGAKEDLKQMAERPQAIAPETLKDAAQKAEESAKPFSENKGAAETLAPPMEAVAKAYEQTVGRAAHLAQLQQEMQELKEQMQTIRQKLEKNRAKSHPASPNQPEQKPAAAVEKTGAAQSQNPQNPQGQPPEQKSAADNQGRPPSDPRAAAGVGEAGPKEQPQEADSTPSEAVQDWMKSLAERGGSLQIELRASLGLTEGLKQLDQVFKQHKQPLQWPINSWTVYGGAYANLGDWIKTVSLLQTELDAQLQAISQLDLLRAMQNEDAPPEYREMVNAYFERLSRETAKGAPNKAN